MRYSTQEEEVNHTVPSWYQGGGDDSQERSSQSELLLYAPQSLCTLDQLLLLVGLQCHVNDIGQTTVSQDTGDAQEDLILHSVHALPQRKRDDTKNTGLAGEVPTSAACAAGCVVSSPGPAWTQGVLCADSSGCFPPGQPQTFQWPMRCSPSA